jgi:hypothetical protein
MDSCHYALTVVVIFTLLNLRLDYRRLRRQSQLAVEEVIDERPVWDWACPECNSHYVVAATEVEVVAHAADAFIAYHAQLGHRVSP